MKAPVFYDPSGRRKRWSIRTLAALLVALVAAACVFAFTIVDVPTPNALDIGIEHPQPRPIPAQIAHVGRVLRRTIGAWLPGSSKAAADVHQQVVGFYVPWDDASKASLVRHIGQLDWLVPDLIFVTGKNHDFVVTRDRVLDAVLRMGTSRPKILPMIQNAQNGVWDSAGAAALMRDAKARKAFLDQLDASLTAMHADGMVFDFEELPASAQRDYLRLIAEAKQRFGPRNMLVTMTVPVGDEDWDLKAYARFADRLFIMDYDEHENSSPPGPIASQAWFVQQMRDAVARIGRAKAIVAIGNYAYDWPKGGPADNDSIEEAWLTAHDSDAQIRFDPVSGNSTFDYTDDSGTPHTVWMLDAASGWNQLKAADAMGVSAVALWRLGDEDPGIWDGLKSFQTNKFPPDLSVHQAALALVKASC